MHSQDDTTATRGRWVFCSCATRFITIKMIRCSNFIVQYSSRYQFILEKHYDKKYCVSGTLMEQRGWPGAFYEVTREPLLCIVVSYFTLTSLQENSRLAFGKRTLFAKRPFRETQKSIE